MKKIFCILGIIISMSAFAESVTVTSKNYVDGLLNTKQDEFPAVNTNTIVTHGNADGVIGQQQIVTTLGTDESAITSPTTGAVNAELNTKQNNVNGNDDYVMTGTGTAGNLGAKPIYSATNNFAVALVTAQTINTVATDAANSKLTCVDNDCLLWQINTSGLTGISTRVYLDPLIDGTSKCTRYYSGDGSDGDCSASTLEYLGASNSKSWKWGVVFPYGDVYGKSVCSSIKGSSVGTPATSSQEVTLNSTFNSQTGNSNSTNQKYCWCKIDGPATSQWVFAGVLGGSYTQTTCQQCPNICSTKIQTSIYRQFRTAIFNTVQ